MHRTIALAACLAMPWPAVAQEAVARMTGPDGSDLGEVTLGQTEHGVLVQADLSGLPQGPHGFHIHETGACEPDFSAAGDHFAPAGNEHGYMNAAGHHAGDMPNITAAADGTAVADVLNAAVTLEEGAENSLMDGDGSAIIVHENPDSYGPDAGAGGRIACGVVEMR